jgi:NADPH2:quinone reductase
MEKALWGGAIDNLGGDYLTWLTRTVDYGGNIASIGLAASAALNTTVLPFILRAVCLLGINSVDTPSDLRRTVWARIGGDLKPQHLEIIGHKTIAFDELPDAFQAYIDGTVTGRVVVQIA